MSAEHTPEPWRIDRGCAWVIVAGDGFSVGETSPGNPEDVSEEEADANARRIVACVNACRDSETEDLERLGKDYIQPLLNLIEQRDELTKALRDVLNMHAMPTEPPTYRDHTGAMAKARVVLHKSAAPQAHSEASGEVRKDSASEPALAADTALVEALRASVAIAKLGDKS